MTEPKIDHERATVYASERCSPHCGCDVHNLARAYLDLAERHRRLREACERALAETSFTAIEVRLRAALAEEDR
jgi:hypothetical protein